MSATPSILPDPLTVGFSVSRQQKSSTIPVARINKLSFLLLGGLALLAESLTERNKLPDALVELNKVRLRAGVAPVQSGSQAELRAFIAKERRMELRFEGQRWFDLVRTGTFFQEMLVKKHPVQEFMVRYPIPQQQIDIADNPQTLPQNPGW